MHAANPDRIEACRRLLAACDGRAPSVSPEALAEQLADWEFIDCAGAIVIRCGPEVHVAAPREVRGRWLTRDRLDFLLGEPIRRFGHAVTSVCRDNPAGQAFVRRLGFREIGAQGESITYELKELRHVH